LRYAVEDIDLRERAGVVIRRGEAILPDFGAAGRDPELLHGAVEDHRRSGIPDGKRSELGIPHAGNLPRCGLSDARGLRELCEAITAGLDAGVRWWTRRIRGTVDVLTGKRRCIRGTASMPGIAAGSPLRSW
jgi:hypothetical protein